MNDDTEYEYEPGNAKAIIDAVERLAQPSEIQLEDDEQGRRRVIALPRGLQLYSLKPFEDERRAAPERREGTAVHTTLDSFCAGVTRFTDENSALFADDNPSAPKLLAVFDYHEANRRDAKGKIESVGEPRFGRHRAVYPFPLSPEWRAWTQLPVSMSQRDFAEFLEEHIGEVMDPERAGESTREIAAQHGISFASPSQLLTLARGLSLRVDTKVAQAVNLSSGEASIQFEETHKSADGSGPVKVPSGFALSIPVFHGGIPYAVVARLRHRVQGTTITWRIMLHCADQCFRHALQEACDVAHKRTGVPLFYGTPERS